MPKSQEKDLLAACTRRRGRNRRLSV